MKSYNEFMEYIKENVTDYLPELNKKNAKFKSLTIEHLLASGEKQRCCVRWIEYS